MTETKPLAWGRQPPEGITLAWGARAIYTPPSGGRDPHIDILHDRQGWRGADPSARKALAEWVNAKGLPAIREACVFENLRGDEDGFVGWRDERGERTRVIEACPNASYGYLYLVAYETHPAAVAEATPARCSDASDSTTRSE